MLAVLGALFPVFGLIALGFALGRSGTLGTEADGVLSRFVGQVTLPVLTFRTIAQMHAGDLAVGPMIVAVVGAAYIVYGLAFAIERRAGLEAAEANIAALASCYGNSAFIGLPVCLALLGPDSLGPSAVVIALNTAFVFGGGVFAGVLTSRGEHSPGEGLRMVARQLGTNPLIVGGIAGFVFAALHIKIAGPVDTLLATLGGATGACSLVAIGLFIAKPLEREAGGPTVRAVAAKLVALPLVTIGLLALLPPLPLLWHATAILMAAMPTAASTFVLAAQAGRRPMQLGAATVVLSTVTAVVILPALVMAFGGAGIAGFAL